jgi:hypothetical protein
MSFKVNNNSDLKRLKNQKSSLSQCSCPAHSKSTKKVSKSKGKKSEYNALGGINSLNVGELVEEAKGGLKGEKIGSFCSDVHTKETFEQFYPPTIEKSSAKSSFLVAHNRGKNLDIAKALDNSKYSDNEHIKKVVKGLRCCSSMSVLQEQNCEARIFKTSDKCRRPLCPICNRIRSTKFVSRFVSAYNSPVGKPLFLNKYFYKIEFTMKHNRKSVRNGVYLDEFKANLKQMQRSKLWKKHFPYSKKDPQSGWANCFEVTITDNGFHIHVHILICAPKFQGRVTKIQQDFRAKWKVITGDSYGCNIDLIKMDSASKKAISEGEKQCNFLSEVMEVFKYTVKVGDVRKLANHADDLGKYIIETKGKNMVTAKGFFRGLQLFGCKSIWDDPSDSDSKKDIEEDDENRYLVGRTVDIEFSEKTHKYIHKYERKKVLESVYIRGVMVDEAERMIDRIYYVMRTNQYDELPRTFIDVSDCIVPFLQYMRLKVFESDFKKLPEWVMFCRDRWMRAGRAVSDDVKDKKECEQLELFESTDKSHLDDW